MASTAASGLALVKRSERQSRSVATGASPGPARICLALILTANGPNSSLFGFATGTHEM
jgi:hypothetical protein